MSYFLIQFPSLMGGVNIAFPKLVRLPEICYRKDTPLIHCLTATSTGLESQIEKQVAEGVCNRPPISTNSCRITLDIFSNLKLLLHRKLGKFICAHI